MAATRFPVATEPVSDTFATSGCFTSALPVSPAPSTTLNTPSGSPASRYISASFKAVRGVTSEGLNTMVLPQASAGADFHKAI